MKATLNIPDTIIKDAQKYSDQKNRTALIIKALEEYTRLLKREKLLSFKGRNVLSDSFDIEKLRQQESDEVYIG